MKTSIEVLKNIKDESEIDEVFIVRNFTRKEIMEIGESCEDPECIQFKYLREDLNLILKEFLSPVDPSVLDVSEIFSKFAENLKHRNIGDSSKLIWDENYQKYFWVTPLEKNLYATGFSHLLKYLKLQYKIYEKEYL